MKARNKGKVYPSTSSSSPFPPSSDIFPILNLLPATILALTSVLSLQEKEVLAYMMTRSISSTNPSSLTYGNDKKNNSKNNKSSSSTTTSQHKPPAFDCECFDCYTSYWFKWDSSSNRELIHHAIEAFEQHLNNGDHFKKNTRGKKKRDKMGRTHFTEKSVLLPENVVLAKEMTDLAKAKESFVKVCHENVNEEMVEAEGGLLEDVLPPETDVVVRGVTSRESEHKGLARKVLPDVLGLLNSRLWNLWSPNV